MDAAADFLSTTVTEFEKLKDLADKALAQVDDASFFRAPDADSNSLAIMVKHVGGNLRSRWTDFLTSDGEKPDRDRDSEFEIGAADTMRPEVPAALVAVRTLGVRRIELLTGDNERTAAAIAEHLGVAYRANLLPEDKIRIVQEHQAAGHTVVMKTADGAEWTFHATEHAVVDTGRGIEKLAVYTGKGLAKGAEVTVHYTEEGGKKVGHFFRTGHL